MKRIRILDIPLDLMTKSQLFETIETFIRSRQPHQLTTVNPEFIVEAQSNPEFKSILQKADLSLTDGVGVIWAARYLGQPLPIRIPGADLVLDLLDLAQAKQWRVFLVGGKAGVAKSAANNLTKAYPDLNIVGAEAGINIVYENNQYIFNDRKTSKLIKFIVTKRPDLLLVAFGAPKQDIFISRYGSRLMVPVMIGVGGTFDFLAGRIKRAPRLIRQLGLEWLWRLVREPSRFKRIYKAIIQFPLLVLIKGRS